MFIFIFSKYAGMSPDCISGIVSIAFLHFNGTSSFFPSDSSICCKIY